MDMREKIRRMRQTYKNKRDFYKAEMEKERSQKEALQRELDAKIKKEAEKKKQEKERYEFTVYCSNCFYVNDVRILNGIEIINGDCTHCRVRSSALKQTLFPVVSYPGKII